ncbi:MAG: hypothetical protein KIH89_002650 [Candidatus Shapirobacteria bacterium]|nr:hypothetical protein [Candidatus Shapirobacteria bacterium]
MNKLKFLSLTFVVIASSFFLSACGKKQTETNNTPTKSVQKELVLSETEKPIISLIPREDGHELKLKIDNIPSNISQIDYELIYSATENDLTMEKGVGDTVKITSKNIEKDLLLGTSSCTNGCKYKYDTGVSEGTLSLIFYTSDNQSATFETPFVLKTSADIKKDGGLSLKGEDFSIKATTTTKSDYFIVIKNYPSYFSVFSNSKGTGKITSITPATITKPDTTSLVGNYLTN